MSNTRWKPVAGHRQYRISNDGMLQSNYSGEWKNMSTSDDRYGYPRVQLREDGGREYKHIHQLVARAFVDGYAPGYQVNHKNGDKHDNRADNLEWVSVRENIKHAYATGLNRGPCKRVRVVETGEVYPSGQECANAIGGIKSGVSACLRGRRCTYKGYHYEYAE